MMDGKEILNILLTRNDWEDVADALGDQIYDLHKYFDRYQKDGSLINHRSKELEHLSMIQEKILKELAKKEKQKLKEHTKDEYTIYPWDFCSRGFSLSKESVKNGHICLNKNYE